MSLIPSSSVARAATQEHGSPLFLYDLDVITARATALRSVLPSQVDVAYAVKANPSLAVVAHIGGLGLRADVASAGELELAMRAGIPPERIVMTGPGKQDQELTTAVAAGLGAITVESLGELERLDRAAAAVDARVRILLRRSVGAAGPAESTRLVGDAGAGKFGMDDEDLVAAARRAVRSAHLDPLGVHAFGASNVTEAAALAEHIRTTVEFGRWVAAAAGFPLTLVDVGGGLGIPYADDEAELDLAALGSTLAAMTVRWATDPVLRTARILLEPGRYLVGPAGAYLSKVVDRKRVGGSEVAVLDGGIHHLLRPALTGQSHRVVLLADDADRAGPLPVTLVGPLCSGLDVLASEVLLPELRVGDQVAILDAGAYGFTESMPFFLSHPIPAEVVTRAGRTSLARPRLEPRTWLDWQMVPGDVASPVAPATAARSAVAR